MLHIGGANIVSGTGELLNLQTAADENLISGKFLFTPQDVIYSKIRPKLRKVVRPDFSGLCSADSYPLRPIDDRTHRDFLFYLLLSRKLTDYAVSGSNRAGIPKVNREHLMAFEFTLPKPKVQERIAAKLNESWKAARQIANELADAKEYRVLRESILREAFAGNL
jgi:type I restriction enzyme S subunit